MEERERLALEVRAGADQVRATLHEHEAAIVRLSLRHPREWDEIEQHTAQLALTSLAALLLADEV